MPRFELRASVPRTPVTVEHSMEQFAAFDGKLYELVEVASTLTGEWTLDYVWKVRR